MAETFTYKLLPRCGFPVRDSKSLLPGAPCGAPAVALARWEYGPEEYFEQYLCQEHLDLTVGLRRWVEEDGYISFEEWRNRRSGEAR